MMDFNSSTSVSGQISTLIDLGLQKTRSKEKSRQYLGASRLGVSCERALQYEYAQAPVDPGRETQGRILRIFERGHVQVGVILIHHLGGVAGQFHAHILWHTRVGQGRIKTVS